MTDLKSSLQLLAVAGLLCAAPLQAASLYEATGTVVYEKVDTFKNTVHLTDTVQITTAGTYIATLTDYETDKPFTESSLDIATDRETVAHLSGPGQVTFEAGAGDYLLNLFASVLDDTGAYEEQRQEFFETIRQERRDRWFASLTDEELANYRAMWKQESAEEKQARLQERDDRVWRYVDHKFEYPSEYGKYGVKVVFKGDGEENVVPVPAALWLMGSGLVGLVAVGRRRKH